jgi:hypothetical protein
MQGLNSGRKIRLDNDPKYAKIIAKNIPNAKLKIYENCGNAIAVDQHEKYIRDITSFIKSSKNS